MTVTARSAGNDVFAPNTYISSIGPGPGFSFVITANPLITVPGLAITAGFAGSQKVSFARIYAFSFEGSIYTLPRPSMFLVHGLGIAIDITTTAGRSTLEASGGVCEGMGILFTD
jgi:hypothetical protein